MADKQSRLAEIYKAEKERGGGVLSTLGKRAKEKFDPRQMFNQKGFAAAALPSLFKSYDAVGKTKKVKELSGTNTGGFSSAVLENGISSLITETRQVKIHSQLAAKNSVVLPSMARDMNVTRQNIVKLVKLQGGTATTKADMFFKRAGDREAAYESKFSKAGGVTSKTPTKEGDKPKEESGGFFSTLITALSGIGGFASKLIGFFSSIFGIILASGIIGQFLADEETKKTVKDFISKVLTKFFDGVSNTFDVIKESFENEDVQKSIRKAISSIIDAIGSFLSIKLGKLFDTPFGEVNLTIGGAIATVIAGFVAFKVAIATLTQAVLTAAGKMAVGGAAGAAGAAGAGGKGRSGPAIGLTAAAAVLPFAVSMYHDYKNKNKKEPTPEEIEQMNQKAKADFINKNGREPTEAEMQSSVSTKISNANQKEATTQKLETAGARAVGDIVAGASGIQGLSNLAPGKAPTTPTVTSKVPEGKLLTAFGSAGEQREMAKNKTMFEKLKVFFTKLQEKPKLMSVFKSKLAVKIGEAAMARLTALGVSLAAAPTTAGISLVFSLALTIWSIYDLYQLYGLVFGAGGLYDEVMNAESDEVSTDTAPAAAAIIPNTTPTVEGAGGAAFGMYSKPGMQPKSAPVPYSAAADSQAANPTSAKATPTAPSSAGAYRGQRSDTAPTRAPTALDITAASESGGRYDLSFGDSPQKDGTIVNVLGKSKNFPQLAGKIIMTPKDFSGKPLNEMTLAEVKEFQDYKNREAPNTNAVGKYQFMRTTLFGSTGKPGLVDQLKLPMDTIFNADTQELLQATMREGNAATLKKEGVAVTDANLNLANAVGATGVAKLLKPENADKNALDVLGYARGGAVALSNPQLNRLSKDVVAETYSKYDASGMAPGGSGRLPSGPSYGDTAVASAANPMQRDSQTMASSLGSMGSTLAGLIGTGGSSAVASVAANAPNMGNVIDSASTGLSEMLRMFDNAMASVTNVTNNTTQASAAPQGQGKLPSVYDDTFASLFQRVA